MHTITLTCPSGAVLEMRKMKTKEVDILSDKRSIKNGTAIDKVLKGIVTEVHDSGIYDWPNGFMSRDLLVGDRVYLITQMHTLTDGANYDFDVRCSYCDARIPWSIDLSSLPVVKLPPESAATYTETNRFSAEAPDGTPYTFRLLNGKGEREAQRLAEEYPHSKITASLMARICEVEGHPDKKAWIEDMDIDDMADVVKHMDSVDCGVETECEVECDACGEVMDVQIPFSRPGTRRRKSAKR